MVIKRSASNATLVSAFKTGGDITFEEGTYKITDTIELYSNSVIDLNGSTLRRYMSKPMFMTHMENTYREYRGAHDVVIKNGTIEGMNSLGYAKSDMIALMHAKNITFENVTFLDMPGLHAIDIVGCRNIVINNCSFLGVKLAEGDEHKEAIQIDFCYYGGLPNYAKGLPIYDMTKCKDITISNCKFGPSKSRPAYFTAIGTHTMANSKGYHENIKIINNTAIGNGVKRNGGIFFHIINMKNVLVQGNTVENYGRFIMCKSPNNLYDKLGNKTPIDNCIPYANNYDEIKIYNNIIKKPASDFPAYAIYINCVKGQSGTVEVNKISGATPKSVSIKNATKLQVAL